MSLTTLREGDKQIPVVARLRLEERAQLSDLQNLYVYDSQSYAQIARAERSDVYRTPPRAGVVRAFCT